MRDTAFWDGPLSEVVAALRRGEAPAQAWAEESRGRIEAQDPRVHAFVERTPATPADTSEAPGPEGVGSGGELLGVPVGVKDIIDVAGFPTRCGSATTSPDPVAADAACVRRLEELGAVVMGKTVTTEYAYFAPGPTENPAAPGHSPRGSSSGSAAAVAAGMVPVALGSQTAGSLTRPAAYCGVAGMVLAHGTADLSGITGLSPSLDSLGLLARTVADLRTVWEAFTGEHPQDEATLGRVHVWQGSRLGDVEPAMREAVQAAAEVLAQHTDVVPLDFGDHVRGLAADHAVIMAREAAQERADLLSRTDEISEPLAELLRTGAATSDDDYQHARYRRDRSRVDLASILGPTDVIVGPAALGPAPRGLGATGSPILSRPWQVLGLPVVTVPGAATADGLPLGIQVVALPGSEQHLFRAAALLEAGLAGHRTSG